MTDVEDHLDLLNTPELLERLVTTLQWNSPVLASDAIRGTYRKILYAFHESLLDQVTGLGTPEADNVTRFITQLDENGKKRLTLAPQTAHYLLRGNIDDTIISFFAASSEAELAFAGQMPADRDVWTALGDAYFPANASGSSYNGDWADFQPDTRFFAPLLGSSILDSVSPYAQSVRGPDGLIADTPSGPHVRRIQRKLEESVKLLAEIHPDIPTFTDREIKTLILRNESCGNAVGSSSSPEYIGQAVLWNAHLENVTAEDLAEQLVHEAIHCHAYCIELQAPFIAAHPRSETPAVVSPWSGRSLRLHSYIHASFVWYGLANLWFTALKRGSLPECDILPHFLRAARGFVEDPLERLATARALIDSSVLLVLNKMHLVVRELLSKSDTFSSRIF